jgi:hypothetical protein
VSCDGVGLRVSAGEELKSTDADWESMSAYFVHSPDQLGLIKIHVSSIASHMDTFAFSEMRPCCGTKCW